MSSSAQIAQFVARYGYAAVASAVFAENLGLPVPGETAVFLAAGSAAAGGHLVWPLIWLAAAVAAVLGDNVGFAAGHFGGERLFKRIAPRLGVSTEEYERTSAFFNRYGGPAVMVARFIPIMRVVGAFTAGTSGMRWRRFLPWQAAGAALWAAYAVAVGYFGDRALGFFKPFLIEEFGRWWPVAVIGAVVAGLAVITLISRAFGDAQAKQTGSD